MPEQLGIVTHDKTWRLSLDGLSHQIEGSHPQKQEITKGYSKRPAHVALLVDSMLLKDNVFDRGSKQKGFRQATKLYKWRAT